MANSSDRRCVFPLTSLQIGDLQSYLSHLHIFLAPETGKFYILVDNRPWLQDLVSVSTHWWQLMVTKSRLSPFANSRGRRRANSDVPDLDTSSLLDESESRSTFGNWFSFSDAVMLSKKRALLPVKKLKNSLIANSKLHRTLYGFIVFEIAWNDIRGINYFNELQTDTSFAIEAKIMRRWEFDSVSQADKSISLWFPGTLDEQILLKEHLDAAIGEVYHDVQETFPGTNEAEDNDTTTNDNTCAVIESPRSPTCTFSVFTNTSENNTPQTPPPTNKPYLRRSLTETIYFDSDLGICSGESDTGPIEILLQASDPGHHEDTLEPTLYRDVLIIFRFKDRDLPFKLKDIIMSKLRLLTLLEAGLPSWVIFLQSYPGFCRLYRPWMCPLARGVYVLMSVVTVLIGFYDLYKNVPLLKTAASNLFGPLFDWVDEWEMISRIKYLGTMLFLHNFQKALKGFLVMSRAVVTFLSFFVQPLAEPFFDFVDCFVPAGIIFMRVFENLFSVIWMVLVSSFTMLGDFLEMLLLPLWYIIMLAWNVVSSFIYPILWVLFYVPFKLVSGLYNLVSFIGTSTFVLFGDLWISAKAIFNLTKGVNTSVSSLEVSMWRSLWKDLLSQLFKALRSIVHGLVAFFAACNRHRLSIYKNVVEFTRRLLQATRNAGSKTNIQTEQSQDKCQSLEREKSPHTQMKILKTM